MKNPCMPPWATQCDFIIKKSGIVEWMLISREGTKYRQSHLRASSTVAWGGSHSRGRFTLWWRSASVGQEFQPKTWLGMVRRRRGKDNQKYIFIYVGFFGGQVSCPRVWSCPKNLTSGELPFKKSVATLATLSFFHPCTKFSIKELLTVV